MGRGNIQNDLAEGINDDGSGIQAFPSEIDLHSGIVTQIAFIGEEIRFIYADNTIESSNTINYTIDSSLNDVIKPELIFLHGKFRLLTADGKEIPKLIKDPQNNLLEIPNPTAKVLPINYTAGTSFKSISVRLNNQSIAEGDTLQAYRGDLEEKLFQNEAVKKTQNYVRGWMEEGIAWDDLTADQKRTIFEAEEELPEGHELRGFVSRWLRSQYSAEFDAITPLHIDICQQPKVLPPGTTLNISLSKQDIQNFNVLTDNKDVNYKTAVTSMHLRARMKKVDPDVLAEIVQVTTMAKTKKDQFYRYPYARVKMMQYSKPKGITDFSEMNVLKSDSVAPSRLFLVFVDQEAFTGLNTKDPLNYQDPGIDYIRLTKNGETVNAPMELNRNKYDILEPYQGLLNAVNLLPEGEESLGINPLNYKKRNFILGWNLRNTSAGPAELCDIPKEYQFNLEIKLKSPSTKAYTMLLYAEYDAELDIDAKGAVFNSEFGLSSR
jgi:hypothetical protein